MIDVAEKKKQKTATPLETRHVFLDTEVYNKLKHNAANRALTLLAEHIAAHRIVLHVTDINLAEIKRQIAEEVEQTRAALTRIEKDLTRWRHLDSSITQVPNVDASSERSTMTTRRPRLANAVAAASPIPLAPPVTTARLPAASALID